MPCPLATRPSTEPGGWEQSLLGLQPQAGLHGFPRAASINVLHQGHYSVTLYPEVRRTYTPLQSN